MDITKEEKEKEIIVNDPWTNTEYESKENSDRFIKVFLFVNLQWLKDNGAKFDKIKWPHTFENGLRGTLAIEDIATNENMCEIPRECMICPPTILESEEGYIFKDHPELFNKIGCEMLFVYLMMQYIKGKDSFFYPYIAILPPPGTFLNWTEEEIAELQDEAVHKHITSFWANLHNAYNKIFDREIGLPFYYPEIFDLKYYTFDLFRWSYHTMSARCFGRRLDWVALVPLADCLNHGNVATKYDYNVSSNDKFRLFPSGTNHYKKGEEALNSYGRRDNLFLLKEYGFCILNNEWEKLSIKFNLYPDDHLYEKRRRVFDYQYFNKSPDIVLSLNDLNFALVLVCRILTADENILDQMMKINMLKMKIFNMEHEKQAIRYCLFFLNQCNDNFFKTDLEDDERDLKEKNLTTNIKNAYYYRMTRKNIIKNNIEMIKYMQEITESEIASPYPGNSELIKNFIKNPDFEVWIKNLKNVEVL